MTEQLSSADTRVIDIWRGFLRAHSAAVALVEDGLRRGDVLPLDWYDVLLALSRAPEHRLRMRELAAEMVLNRSNLTRLADRLEEAGYLVREPTPGDRRGTFACLTAAGQAVLERTEPVLITAIERWFGRFLTEADAGMLAVICTRIYTAAESAFSVD